MKREEWGSQLAMDIEIQLKTACLLLMLMLLFHPRSVLTSCNLNNVRASLEEKTNKLKPLTRKRKNIHVTTFS